MSAEVPDSPLNIEALYDSLSRELWAVFYSQCGDPERALDAVQESFLKLQRYQGDPLRDARAWLLRVGQNWLRDVARRKASSCRLLPAMEDFVSQPFQPETVLETQENRQQLRSALLELNEDDRKALVLKYSMGWSAARIALAMDCSPAAVDMRLSRARRRLADVLTGQGYDHGESTN